MIISKLATIMLLGSCFGICASMGTYMLSVYICKNKRLERPVPGEIAVPAVLLCVALVFGILGFVYMVHIAEGLTV